MEYWEIDLRSRKDGNSVETIFSGESHDDACACLNKWYDEHPEVDVEADRESFIDGTDGVFADIYCTDTPHGAGKWQQKHNFKKGKEWKNMTEEIKKYIRDEARLLENVGDSFGVILGNNKGLLIQLDNSCGDIEYFIELNDIEEDGSCEPCASYNQTSVFGDIDKLIVVIEGYLEDVL